MQQIWCENDVVSTLMRRNHVVSTSMRRNHVASTLNRRHFLGSHIMLRIQRQEGTQQTTTVTVLNISLVLSDRVVANIL